jgi:hypothetical protein
MRVNHSSRKSGGRALSAEAADDAGLALRQYQLGPADDEHRRADHRQTQAVAQQLR